MIGITHLPFPPGRRTARRGIVGIGTINYHRLGTEMAAQVASVFTAGSATSVPVVKSDAFTLTFDWRQLRRWGLDPSQLPEGSDLRFRQPWLWEAHRGKMICLVDDDPSVLKSLGRLLASEGRPSPPLNASRPQRKRHPKRIDLNNIWIGHKSTR